MSTALALTMMVTPAMANFYNDEIGYWSIFGFEGTPTDNKACVLEMVWQDGSRFQLIKDLVDGELYIFLKNNDWNISNPEGVYEFEMVIINENNTEAVSGVMEYILLNKNTIVVRGLDADGFVPPFTSLDELRFIMPGNIQNAYVDLENSNAAIQSMSKCIDKASRKKSLGGSDI